MRFELIQNGFAIRCLNHSAILSIFMGKKKHLIWGDALIRFIQQQNVIYIIDYLLPICFCKKNNKIVGVINSVVSLTE